jgi:hypothetical protein
MLGLEDCEPAQPEYRPQPFETNAEMDQIIDMLVEKHDELVKHNNRRPREEIDRLNRITIVSEGSMIEDQQIFIISHRGVI